MREDLLHGQKKTFSSLCDLESYVKDFIDQLKDTTGVSLKEANHIKRIFDIALDSSSDLINKYIPAPDSSAEDDLINCDL